jgi:hypothetical protein
MEKNMMRLQHREEIEIFDVLNASMAKEKLTNICNHLLDDHFYIAERYPIIKLQGDNIWLLDPLCDRSWRFWLHSLSVIEHLVNGYKKSGEIRYIEKACEILWDWKKHNVPRSPSEMAWHDHSTAIRLIMICKLFESWRKIHWDPDTVLMFSDLANTHCIKLSDPEFYMEKHNHGMDQDIALYLASAVFDNLKTASQWRELALKRFWLQINQLFAPDGSYLEHSPGYSSLFFHRLYHVMEFLKKQGNDEHKKLKKTIEAQLHFLTHMVQPDGQVPPIGDSTMKPLKIGSWISPSTPMIQKLIYATSCGQKGTPPDQLDTIFPYGGYAVMRNQWIYNENTIQVILYSSFHSMVHKHHDDLALTLFGHGQPLLVDAGLFNYNYDSPERKYVVSTRAHNTVVVNDRDTETTRLNIGKSGLDSYCFDRGFAVVSGRHCLYQGMIHRRIVLYLKPWDCLVLDWLHGYQEQKCEQIFNFDPSLECQVKGHTIVGSRNKKQYISLSPLCHHERIETNVVRAQQDPLRGWSSLQHGKLEPAWSGGFTCTGTQARFATHIRLKPDRQDVTNFEWQADRIKLTFGGSEYQIIISDQHVNLAVNNQLAPMMYIPQPHLEKASQESRSYLFREMYRAERRRRLALQKQLEKFKKSGEGSHNEK